jgi:hypothetical protein
MVDSKLSGAKGNGKGQPAGRCSYTNTETGSATSLTWHTGEIERIVFLAAVIFGERATIYVQSNARDRRAFRKAGFVVMRYQ